MSSTAMKSRSQVVWLTAYVSFASIVSVIAAMRLWWSGPDVSWQSNFWFIDDVNKLLNGDYAHVTWFVFGDQWAMNGYRWFEYINAAFFGLDTRLEIVCFYSIALALSLLIGLRILSRLPAGQKIGVHLATFLIPLVFMSFAGAGSRGMELGTFTGIPIIVALFLFIDSRGSTKTFAIVTSIVVPLVIFIYFGGYVSGPVVALVLVWALQFWRSTLGRMGRVRLNILTLNFVIWTIVYFVVLRAMSPATGGSEVGHFFSETAKNPLLPAQFLFWGPSAGLFTSQTMEGLGVINIGVAICVSLLIITSTFWAGLTVYRHAWSQATVPLLLMLYPWGIALTLLFTRGTAQQGLLDTWYSLHFKVGIVGVVWLIILALKAAPNRFSAKTSIAVFLLAAVAASVLVANVNQFARQPYERAYFLNIAKDALFPASAVVSKNGFTSLQVTKKETLRASAILKKHELGVFRDPQETIDDLYGKGTKVVPLGEVYPDGWAGKKFSLMVLSSSCKTLTVNLKNPLSTGTPESVLISSSFAAQKSTDISPSGTVLNFKPTGEAPEVHFEFSTSVVPSRLDKQSSDTRSLSALAQFTCTP